MDALNTYNLFNRAQELRHLKNEEREVRLSAVIELAIPALTCVERCWYSEEEATEAASIVLDLARDLRLEVWPVPRKLPPLLYLVPL